MLEGKNVNLKIVEKDDLPLLPEWFNSLDFTGNYDPVDAQQFKTDIEKNDKLGSEEKWFFIEKKDGSKVGFIGTHPEERWRLARSARANTSSIIHLSKALRC